MNSEKLTHLLGGCSTRLELPKGQTILCQGDEDENIYYIAQGKVRILLNSYTGCEKIIYILKNGDFFNEQVLIQEMPSMISALCEESCRIFRIHPSILKEKSCYKEVFQVLFEQMLIKNQNLIKEVENISFSSCRQRILQIFANSCDRTKLYDLNWHEVPVRYTHQDLASIIGANRVTVSKIILELCECGELRTINRKIQIHRKTVNKENQNGEI